MISITPLRAYIGLQERHCNSYQLYSMQPQRTGRKAALFAEEQVINSTAATTEAQLLHQNKSMWLLYFLLIPYSVIAGGASPLASMLFVNQDALKIFHKRVTHHFRSKMKKQYQSTIWNYIWAPMLVLWYELFLVLFQDFMCTIQNSVIFSIAA